MPECYQSLASPECSRQILLRDSLSSIPVAPSSSGSSAVPERSINDAAQTPTPPTPSPVPEAPATVVRHAESSPSPPGPVAAPGGKRTHLRSSSPELFPL
ncbi:taperin-like [Fundulus heteroclitus]|uniref:taperin-like n=1 Tax=Fundulus heteroclitus TaxID=8078 RepID=UPI00165B8665|nr:taperin-like [Fundulus heteroclitus]